MLKPHSQRPNRVLVSIAERVNSATSFVNSGSFIRLARFLIPADCLCRQFIVNDFADNASAVAHVNAEQLLAQGEDADACAAAESDVQIGIEQLLVAIQECIVKGDAAFVGIQLLVVAALQVVVVFTEHVAKVLFCELR